MAALVKRCAKYHLHFLYQLLPTRTFNVDGSKRNIQSEPKNTRNHYDIIIGGGGLVGSTLAAAFAKNRVLSSKRILLLEAAPKLKKFNPAGQYSNRVSAINNRSVELFKKIGVWNHMKSARVKPVKQMQVWDASSDALIQFHQEKYASDVAWIIENDLILDAMYAMLIPERFLPIIEIRNEALIENIELPLGEGKNYSTVGLKSGERFTCDLLIGADGHNSLIRRKMKMDVFHIDYKRYGLVATVQLADAGENTMAWQRFIPTGPVALLPLGNNISSVVWSTTFEHAKQLVEMPAAEFTNALNEAFCKEYEQDTLVIKAMTTLNSIVRKDQRQKRQYPPRIVNVLETSRAAYPLRFLHASSYFKSGAALIGEAAHRIHPLPGQGVNLGFSDVLSLVEALSEGVYAGFKLNDEQCLIKYERKSLAKNVTMMIGMHGLHTLYSTTYTPAVLMRSLGLQLTDRVSTIKTALMKRVVG